jgi:hypothetical protein
MDTPSSVPTVLYPVLLLLTNLYKVNSLHINKWDFRVHETVSTTLVRQLEMKNGIFAQGKNCKTSKDILATDQSADTNC